jgi:sugar phosphate isomerase/epimerase
VGGIRTLTEAWGIVEAAGRANGGLTIDAWHFFRSGSTLEQLARIPGERIHTVQLCDAPAAPQTDLWAELMTARLLPGEGELDLSGLIRTLDAIGSTAPIGVEIFNTRQNDQPLTQIAQDWTAAARSVLAQARGNA